jgi:hypothetical protein
MHIFTLDSSNAFASVALFVLLHICMRRLVKAAFAASDQARKQRLQQQAK